MNIIWHVIENNLQKEGKEGPGEERGKNRAGPKHQHDQSPICSQGGPISHTSKDQGQGISTAGRGTHGRMSAVICVALLRYVVRVCCVVAKVLSRRQPTYQNISLWFLFLFLIIGSDELHFSNMACFSRLLELIKTCFELRCWCYICLWKVFIILFCYQKKKKS